MRCSCVYLQPPWSHCLCVLHHNGLTICCSLLASEPTQAPPPSSCLFGSVNVTDTCLLPVIFRLQEPHSQFFPRCPVISRSSGLYFHHRTQAKLLLKPCCAVLWSSPSLAWTTQQLGHPFRFLSWDSPFTSKPTWSMGKSHEVTFYFSIQSKE